METPSNPKTEDYTYKQGHVITFTGGISQVISKNLLTEDIQFKSYTIKDGLASDLVQMCIRDSIYDEHVFTGASGTNVLRLLPPLCLTMEEAEDFLARFKKVL